jgi:hypothetical protein
MMGTVHDVGVIPYSIAYLFAARAHTRVLLSMRMVEVHDNCVLDLLSPEVLRAAGVVEAQIYSATYHNTTVHEVLLSGRVASLKLLAEVTAAVKRRGDTDQGSEPVVVVHASVVVIWDNCRFAC